MSIYCSFGGFDDHPCVDYSRPAGEDRAEAYLSDGRTFMLLDQPCAWDSGCSDCNGREAPFVYQRSHVMPRLDDERGGDVHLAFIADHIPTPRERLAGIDYVEDREDGSLRHPWLRIGVNGETVVLHREQVGRLVTSLQDWLVSDFLSDDEYRP